MAYFNSLSVGSWLQWFNCKNIKINNYKNILFIAFVDFCCGISGSTPLVIFSLVIFLAYNKTLHIFINTSLSTLYGMCFVFIYVSSLWSSLMYSLNLFKTIENRVTYKIQWWYIMKYKRWRTRNMSNYI